MTVCKNVFSVFRGWGATLIASAAAVEDQQARNHDQFFMLNALVGEKA